jgi:hypothetical protein
MRLTHVAGEKTFLDFAGLTLTIHEGPGVTFEAQVFVAALGASNLLYVEALRSQDLASFVGANERAFHYYGGVSQLQVPDNLKSAVTTPDRYEPIPNATYTEFCAHYNTAVLPTRVRKPRDKPRVERAMPYVRDSFWRGRDFTSEGAMQEAALVWCDEVAGRRHDRSLEGVQPLELFHESEAPALRVLPPSPFELASWSTPKVGPDCHVKVGRTLYSVPWRYLGRRLDARESDRTVEIFCDGVVIKTWARLERGRQSDWADYPPEKVAFFMRTPQWCRQRARELGPHVREVVDVLMDVNALHRLRSTQGVIRLDERYEDRLDAACQRALQVGDPSYRTVKGILVAGTEHEGERVVNAPSAPAHLHGPEGLFEWRAS